MVKAKLTSEEDAVWTNAFIYWVNEGLSDIKADRKAWEDTVEQFPRLKEYDGALP